MTIKSLVFSLIVFLPCALSAQSVITGQVRDNSNNAPVEYASVLLYSMPDSSLVTGTVTDDKGKFTLSNIKKGSYYLHIKFLGYNDHIVNDLELSRKDIIGLGILMMEANQQLLEEIEIRGEKAVSYHKIDRQVYSASEFQSSQGGTAVDVLRNMPSVNVNPQGEITVRGLSGFVVLLNGKPIQSSASLLLNQIPANSIENVEIITSPSAKYDPEGMAGMINIITKKGVEKGIFTQINTRIGLPSIEDYDNAENAPRYGADVSFSVYRDKWDISAGAGYLRNDISGRRVGDVYTLLNDTLTRFPSDGERSFDEISYSGRFTLGYHPDKHNNMSLGFFAGEHTKDRTADILYYDNHAVYPPTGERLYTLQYYNENLRIRRGDFILGSLDYEHTFPDKSKLTSSFLYEYTMLGGPTTNLNLSWPDLQDTLQHQYNTNDNPLYGLRFQLDYVKPLDFGTIESGYQFRDLDHTGDFIYEERTIGSDNWNLIPEFSSRVNLSRRIHSIYGLFSGKIDRLNYSAGLRVEKMDRELELFNNVIDTTYHYDFLKLYPSANLLYDVTNDLRIKAGYSRRVERTTTFKMNPFPEREHSETLEQGDPRLLPEFIDLVELGVVQDYGNNSSFLTLYYQHINNLINRVNTVFNDSILNRIYSNVGNAASFGVEVGSELNLFDKWKIFAGGNIYRYGIDGTFDERPVNTSSWIYSINANTTYEFTASFSFQWSVNYISARNTAQGEDSRYLSPNLTLRKSFLNNRLSTTLQWLNMDMGLLPTNEQRITTWRDNEFYTTTNYIYEVDMIMVNISYLINQSGKKARFIKSEFGEKEF